MTDALFENVSVLELLLADLQGGLDSALSLLRRELMSFFEEEWGKYDCSLERLTQQRLSAEERLDSILNGLFAL